VLKVVVVTTGAVSAKKVGGAGGCQRIGQLSKNRPKRKRLLRIRRKRGTRDKRG
jgi:hypothetical protein